jgi:hypothetical protein
MDEAKVKADIAKAIEFKNDGTYTDSEFTSHVFAIIRDNTDTGVQHVRQLKRLIFKTGELTEALRTYWAGDKNKKSHCKALVREMDIKLINLKSMGYSIEEYTKEPPKQNDLFNG